MKNKQRISSIIGTMFCLMLLVGCVATEQKTSTDSGTNIAVDPAARYHTMAGWGTSLSWWATQIGGWSDENRDAIADLIFDEEKGLGLTVVRYNIGGQDGPGHAHMRTGGDVKSFKATEDGDYDWTVDANQRWMLQAAIDRGADITEAVAYSPPWWMTASGCTGGATDPIQCNLKADYFDDFADYLTDVVKHFRDEWGVEFDTLAPMNEPNTNYWKAGGFNQGCHYGPEEQMELYKMVLEQIKAKGLDVKLSASDETSADHAVKTFLAYDDEMKDLLYQINVHTYWTFTKRAELRKLANEYDKVISMSEICYNSVEPGMEKDFDHIKGALDVAWSITVDQREMQPDQWVFWQPTINDIWRDVSSLNYGLIHADYDRGTEEWSIRKKYYGFAHYAKFIRPGFQMIGIAADDAVAFVDWDNGDLIIVAYNLAKEPRSRNYDLHGFTTLPEEVEIYRTTQSENLAELPKLRIINKSLKITEPASSVTTYVLKGIAYDGPVDENPVELAVKK